MKEAKAKEYWKAIHRRPYKTRIEHLDFQDVPNLGNNGVSFSAGLTAICGGNGAGKTTLLEAIFTALAGERNNQSTSAAKKFSGATLTVRGTVEDVPVSVQVPHGNPPLGGPIPSIQATFLDPAAESRRVLSLLQATANFAEILEAITPRQYSTEELDEISYLVGKKYTACSLYEIEDFGEEEAFPYSHVVAGSSQYGSESMGQGELAIHILTWQLDRMPEGSVVLIEEPEAHLAPRSQLALMNHVARAITKKGLCVIITTHSPAILLNIPRDNIRLVARADDGIQLIERPTKVDLDTVLGSKPRFSGLLLVEDKAAREFVLALLERLSPDIARTNQVIDMGSHSDISVILNRFPHTAKWLAIVGIYDGDQRGEDISPNWPYLFLPGTAGPERLLRDAVNAAQLSAALSRPESSINLALSSLEGNDDHDWLEGLGPALGIPYERVMAALVETWLNSPSSAELANELIKKIHQKMNTTV